MTAMKRPIPKTYELLNSLSVHLNNLLVELLQIKILLKQHSPLTQRGSINLGAKVGDASLRHLQPVTF